MHRLTTIAALGAAGLALAACSSPLEELYPVQRYVFEQDGRTYDVRAQWDPFERGWFTQTALRHGRLEPGDRTRVFALVQQTLGPQLCEGNPLEVTPELVWTRHGQWTVRYLPEIGTWHLVGECA